MSGGLEQPADPLQKIPALVAGDYTSHSPLADSHGMRLGPVYQHGWRPRAWSGSYLYYSISRRSYPWRIGREKASTTGH